MTMLLNLAISSGYCLGSIECIISRSVRNSSVALPIKLSPGTMLGPSLGTSKTFFWYGFNEKFNFSSNFLGEIEETAFPKLTTFEILVFFFSLIYLLLNLSLLHLKNMLTFFSSYL